MQQKSNLTIEEILRMSPNFVHKLQELSEKEKEKIESLSSMDIQGRPLTFGFKEIPKPNIHYACPLGFMEIFIGNEEYLIKALVNTGAELNIIPEEIAIKASLTTRNITVNLRGIGGHTTSLVALSEFPANILASGEETQIHFFIAKGSFHELLGRHFLAHNNVRLGFSHKQGEILSYQEPYGRRLCMPICKLHALGWQTGPPIGMDLCNMKKLVRNTPGKKFQNAKGDNTIINDLKNKILPNNLKRKLEDSTSEDELPNVFYNPINETEEIFQILVDGNEKINGNSFTTKTKSKKVRFSEHHELSDEEIINEIEKDFQIMEEREKNLKDTYHINFLDRPLNNQEEPYEWKNPEFIQKPPKEEEETESILENEYNYLYLQYITFEDLYGDEAQDILCEDKYLCHLPGPSLSKIPFLELLNKEGSKGNLSNQFWDKTFSMGILPRRGLYFNQIWAQWYLGLNRSTYQTGRLKWVGDGYTFIDEDLWWS
ncbi:hypothetical protein O181_060721 [Austropuccinia psidii MF-1]|uniref:Peptidase A2 domain-containing protein n=1 Tax=Austropuccinia psidii MF-1 TaxID=1389203 RepID=A0A9Q3HWV7_9BASI|nr:hypothetical protein [Austropuccinia psidii MF-1]